MRLSETSMLLYGLPGWKKIMGMPLTERAGKFGDADTRTALVAEMKKPRA